MNSSLNGRDGRDGIVIDNTDSRTNNDQAHHCHGWAWHQDQTGFLLVRVI